MSLVPTLSVSDLPAIGATAIRVEGVDVVLVRDGSASVFALRDECTHAQVRLSEGEVEPGTIECWLHSAQFDLATGRALCLPATGAVDTYRVELHEGVVHVDVHSPAGQNRADSGSLPTQNHTSPAPRATSKEH